MRILQFKGCEDVRKIMQGINVDKYGIDIMLPKAISFLIKLNSVSNITANILKQEMLSLGADCAVSRTALTGRIKKTDCLLIGNASQFGRLSNKLKLQPFGLDKLAVELNSTLNNYGKDRFLLNLGRYKLELGKHACIMGIVNLTPDSFSGDGLYRSEKPEARSQEDVVNYTEKLVRDGADIVDIGGESSRPGARPVPLKEELKRTIPAIKKIAKKIKVPISIDTRKAQVAEAALDAGASIINDITALRNKDMVKVAAKYKCGIVLMHMKGKPSTMQKNPVYCSLVDEIIEYLSRSINIALDAGIDREKIIIDPGIGFGKTTEHNLAILKSLKEFKILGLPILAGPSRKSFIGKILNECCDKRLFGTLASSVVLALNGAHILRVHDVKEIKQGLAMLDAIAKI